MKYSPHDADLDEKSAAELQLLLMELRGKVRALMAETGNARCHLTLHELFELLPEGDTAFLPLADREAFLRQCAVFYDTGQCPSQAGRHTCPTCHGAGVVPPSAQQTRP